MINKHWLQYSMNVFKCFILIIFISKYITYFHNMYFKNYHLNKLKTYNIRIIIDIKT
jgi:hypothetical protein